MSGVKQQRARVEQFTQRLATAALLYPNHATVLFLRELVKNNEVEQAAKHYSHMLEMLPT